MNILVDTSVWIDHLHRASPELRETLESGVVVTHSAVIGELACGNMANRAGGSDGPMCIFWVLAF